MTAERTNCYTVSRVCMKVDGVPFGRDILLSNSYGRIGVHLGENCDVMLENAPKSPHRFRLHLIRAKAITRNGKLKLAKAGQEIKSIIVQVVCRELYFDVEPLAEGLNLWPGGDGDILPFAQWGEHKNGLDKIQLFEIPNGKYIYLVDQKKAVARLSCVDGNPVISTPDISELARFLSSRAQDQYKVQALDWALHNLRALLKKEVGTELIRNLISELSRLRETH